MFRVFPLSLILLLLCQPCSVVQGQVKSALPTTIPCSQKTFSLPFEIARNPEDNDPTKEVELLYSDDFGTRWYSAGKASVSENQIPFSAPKDGEYLFTFRVIKESGAVRPSPGGPQIRVLVDTVKPLLTLDAVPVSSGEIQVTWRVEEKNLRGKTPDFAVCSLSPLDIEKNWKSLVVDQKHSKQVGAITQGRFVFLPDTEDREFLLRAVISDIAENREEKTITVSRNAVKETVTTESETSEPVNFDGQTSPVLSALPADFQTGPLDHVDSTEAAREPETGEEPAMPLNPDSPVNRKFPVPKSEVLPPTPPLSSPETNRLPGSIKPPKPLRVPVASKNLTGRDSTNFKTASDQGDATRKTNGEITKVDVSPQLLPAYHSLPTLNSPTGDIAELLDEHTEKKPNLGDLILSEMSQHGLSARKTPIKEAKSSVAVVHPPVADNRAVSEKTEVVKSGDLFGDSQLDTLPPSASTSGSIAGIALNQELTRPRIFVRWHVTDPLWRDAQVDILRGASARGPWFPIATNLPNNGEYWWYLTQGDLRPFHIAIRTRLLSGGELFDSSKKPSQLPSAIFEFVR